MGTKDKKLKGESVERTDECANDVEVVEDECAGFRTQGDGAGGWEGDAHYFCAFASAGEVECICEVKRGSVYAVFEQFHFILVLLPPLPPDLSMYPEHARLTLVTLICSDQHSMGTNATCDLPDFGTDV